MKINTLDWRIKKLRKRCYRIQTREFRPDLGYRTPWQGVGGYFQTSEEAEKEAAAIVSDSFTWVSPKMTNYTPLNE